MRLVDEEIFRQHSLDRESCFASLLGMLAVCKVPSSSGKVGSPKVLRGRAYAVVVSSSSALFGQGALICKVNFINIDETGHILSSDEIKLGSSTLSRMAPPFLPFGPPSSTRNCSRGQAPLCAYVGLLNGNKIEA